MSYFPDTHPLAATGHLPISLKAAVVAIALLSLGLWAAVWLVVTDLF